MSPAAFPRSTDSRYLPPGALGAPVVPVPPVAPGIPVPPGRPGIGIPGRPMLLPPLPGGMPELPAGGVLSVDWLWLQPVKMKLEASTEPTRRAARATPHRVRLIRLRPFSGENVVIAHPLAIVIHLREDSCIRGDRRRTADGPDSERVLKAHPSLRIGIAALVLGVGAYAAARRSERSNPPPRSNPAAGAREIEGIRFTNVATQAGLQFGWPVNPKRPLRNLDTFGCGCAFLDFDSDGWLDILLVGEPRCALFRNDRRGRFTDISAETGLNQHLATWKGCAVGDYDGDGYPDLLLTAFRGLRLLRNDGGKALADVTLRTGLPADNRNRWGSGAGFMDLDADRDLDLVTLNYVVFNEATPQFCQTAPGVMSGCPPQTYRPEYGVLWQNVGGTYRDATRAAGFRKTHGKGLVVGFCDYDADGRIDFYVGNDGTPADLMRNLGGLRFENVGQETGTAFGIIPGQPIAAMGVDWADADRDGNLDFAVSAFENEAYCLYLNEGGGFFRNATDEVGLTGPTMRPLGFGTNFLDADNDGYPELFFANGHVYDNVAEFTPGATFRQPMMLFRNERGTAGARRFTDLAPRLGGEWTRPLLGRGSARGDFDNDGRTDLLVVDYEGEPLLLRNESPARNHWLAIAAKGRGGNRLGYGLRATARCGGETWIGELSPSSSYLSTSEPRIHLGLGGTTRLDTVELRWPSGRRQRLRDVPVDRLLTVTEPR